MWRHKLRYYFLHYRCCPISQERYQSIKFDQSITWKMLLLKYHTQYVWRNSSQILLYKVKIKHIFGSTVWILIQFLFNLCSSWGYLWKYPSQCTQKEISKFSLLVLFDVILSLFLMFYSILFSTQNVDCWYTTYKFIYFDMNKEDKRYKFIYFEINK